MFKSFSNNKNIKFLFTFFLISASVAAIWFRKGLMFGGGEEGLPLYNPSKYLTLISHIWHDANGGYPALAYLPAIPYAWVLSVLSRVGINTVLLQAITFFAIILSGCLSVFYLTKETIGEKLEGRLKNLVPLLAGLFYFFNPYSMSQVWGRGIYGQFFGFGLIPLFLLLFILGLKRRNFIFGALAILASFLFSASFVVVTQAVIMWVPPLIYLVFHLVKNIKDKKVLLFSFFYTAFTLLAWFFSNFWWIFPTLQSGREAYSVFFADSNNINGFIGSSKMYFRPTHVIRLLQGFYFFIAYSFGKIYTTLPFQLLSWMIPVVSSFSLFYFKKIKELKFFLALFLLGFIVSVGANPPMGALLVWLFVKISFLQAFRNSYEKAGLLLMLAYAPLFALGLPIFSNKLASYFDIKRKKILPIIFGVASVILVCGIFVWTLWTGTFQNAWFKVPDYYKEADTWLSFQPGDFRVMQMPLIPGDGVRYDWEFAYQGIEPGEFLFTKSSIGRNIALNKIYYNVFAQRLGIFSPGAFGPDPDISESEFRSQTFIEELAKLNVRYIVFHNDLNGAVAGVKVEPQLEYLSKQKNIKLVKTFGKLDIYQVFIPENIARIYSPDIKTEATKVSSDYYVLKVEGVKKPVRIYFLDLYDSGWEAYIDGKKIDTHGTVFSYANSWTVNKTGSFDLIIKYSPQDYVTKGWKITEITFILLGGILAYTIFRRRK